MNLMTGFGGAVTKSLIFRFVADTARASRKIDALMSKVRGTQGTGMGRMGYRDNFLTRLLRRHTQGFEEMGEAGGAAFDKIAKKIGIAAGALIGFGYAMRQTFKFGTLIENSLVSLEVLQGSAEKAHETMRQAIKFSLLTPFTPSEVFAATQASAQYNIDLYKKGAYGLGRNQNVAQILAGMGSFVDMSGKKIGMARAAHAVMRGDYRLLRQYRGLVSPAFEAAKAAGKVGTPEFTQKFIEGLGKIPQIMDMAKKQSETVSGLWSTITGTFEEFWIRFSGAGEKRGVVTFWSHIRSMLLDIREFTLSVIEYMGPGLTDIGAGIGAAIETVWKNLKLALNVLKPVLKLVFNVVRVLAILFEGIAKAIGKIYDFFTKIFNKIGDVADALFGLEKKTKDKGPGLFEDAIAFLKAQMMIADVLLDWALNSLLGEITKAFDAFVGFINAVRSGNVSGWIKKEARNKIEKEADEFYRKYPQAKGFIQDAPGVGFSEYGKFTPAKKKRELELKYYYQFKDRWKDVKPATQAPPEGSLEEMIDKTRKIRKDTRKGKDVSSVINIYNGANFVDFYNNLNHGRPSTIEGVPEGIGVMPG